MTILLLIFYGEGIYESIVFSASSWIAFSLALKSFVSETADMCSG